jgi:curved DNA-binding protein CbpA
MWKLTARLFFSAQKFDTKKDYYKVLLLNKDATKEQIKKSFRDLAKKHHPDSKGGQEDIFK